MNVIIILQYISFWIPRLCSKQMENHITCTGKQSFKVFLQASVIFALKYFWPWSLDHIELHLCNVWLLVHNIFWHWQQIHWSKILHICGVQNVGNKWHKDDSKRSDYFVVSEFFCHSWQISNIRPPKQTNKSNTWGVAPLQVTPAAQHEANGSLQFVLWPSSQVLATGTSCDPPPWLCQALVSILAPVSTCHLCRFKSFSTRSYPCWKAGWGHYGGLA